MKQPIRYFSIGLLTASLIVLIVVSFFDKPNDQVNQISEGSVDEMITVLQDEGYHVLSSSEYITLSVGNEQLIDDEPKDEQDDKSENSTAKEDNEDDTTTDNENDTDEEVEEDTKEVHEFTLTIEPNMLGPTISELLETNNIIDDADEFNRYLETEGYAPYLQLGDHEVSSDMSHYEIAEVIARSR